MAWRLDGWADMGRLFCGILGMESIQSERPIHGLPNRFACLLDSDVAFMFAVHSFLEIEVPDQQKVVSYPHK